jgi:hypothetical protein
MQRPVYRTKSVVIGVILTVITATVLVVLVVIAKDFHLWLVIGSIIAFQLSFIWTCAELLDGPDEELRREEPRSADFTH